MTKWSHFALPWLALVAVSLAAAGCNPATTTGNPPGGTNPPLPGPQPGLKSAMSQIGKGKKDALWRQLKDGLTLESPPWDDLQPKAEKFSALAAELQGFKPPKGQDSWAKDAQDFAAHAADLYAAVKEHSHEKAGMALQPLGNACDDCHRAHGGPPHVND